ncbi:MAG TPA: TetR/AcrR family transcriptional regulator [Steroidobacteraceae bacterium]|nr:TetR/AcrR family transcriptional regulator [Steroidobacteraceae bacterium]
MRAFVFNVTIGDIKYRTRKSHRQYRQVARAESSAATAQRIVEAFAECALTQWLEDVTLAQVAALAGVTVRSVIRRFGGKEGLIAAFIEHLGPRIRVEFTGQPGNIEDAVERLVTIYERYGDGTIRNLAQESRVPALRPLLEFGRREHRQITSIQFAPWLDHLDDEERERALNALVIATDVYTWKLLRRDMGRSKSEVTEQLKRLIRAVLGEYAADRQREGD